MRPVTFESVETLSQAEFEEWVLARPPSDLNRYELLNGRIVMNPPAGWPHGEVGALLVQTLTRFVREHGAGRVFDASQGFTLPSGDDAAPDASFVSKERWAAAPPPEPGKFLRVVPDLVVEVLSPGRKSYDRGEKKAIYERNGVREYWLADPASRTLTRFVLTGDRFDAGSTFEAADAAPSTVLAGLSFRGSELFPER